jgi:hypothetical protein
MPQHGLRCARLALFERSAPRNVARNLARRRDPVRRSQPDTHHAPSAHEAELIAAAFDQTVVALHRGETEEVVGPQT